MHWHDDYLFGNSVIQEAWPGHVRIIGTLNTRTDATSKAFEIQPQGSQGQHGAHREVPDDAEDETPDSGRSATNRGPAKAGRTGHRGLQSTNVREVQTVKAVLPNLTFEDELILHTGGRTIRASLPRPGKHARRRDCLPAEGTHSRDRRPGGVTDSIRHPVGLRRLDRNAEQAPEDRRADTLPRARTRTAGLATRRNASELADRSPSPW